MPRNISQTILISALFLGVIALQSVAVFQAGASFGLIAPGFWHMVILLKFISLPILLIATTYIGGKVRSKILNFFYVISATWLAVLAWLFCATVLLSFYMILVRAFGGAPNMYPLALGACVIILAMTIYGIFHAQKIQITEYEVDAPALSKNWRGKKIVFVSDLHLGMVRGKYFMNRIAQKITALGADIVFIPGDIIDGPSFDYKNVLAPLQNIKSAYGTFFTPGNHEKFNREPEIWTPILKSYVTILADQKVEVNGTQIIGLDYAQEKPAETKARLVKTGYEKDKLSIIMLHDPKHVPALAELGASLVLSGHTHLGQLWPLKWLVKGIYKKFAYGMVKTGETVSITSSGVGTAVSPIRLGTKAEIVVVEIK